MKGTIKFILNQETMMKALQEHLTKQVFDASQLATVVDLKPTSIYPPFAYEVLIDCDPEPTAAEPTAQPGII